MHARCASGYSLAVQSNSQSSILGKCRRCPSNKICKLACSPFDWSCACLVTAGHAGRGQPIRLVTFRNPAVQPRRAATSPPIVSLVPTWANGLTVPQLRFCAASVQAHRLHRRRRRFVPSPQQPRPPTRRPPCHSPPPLTPRHPPGRRLTPLKPAETP